MAQHEASIDVKAPLEDVYGEWTDYAAYARFMDGVQEVRRLDDGRIRWRAELASRPREWEAEVEEDRRAGTVSWRSVSGAQWDGDVTLVARDEASTTVRLRIEYDSAGEIEGAASAAKAVRARVERILKAFGRYAEERHAGRREAASG
jgi:uncharacterized membrane protein